MIGAVTRAPISISVLLVAGCHAVLPLAQAPGDAGTSALVDIARDRATADSHRREDASSMDTGVDAPRLDHGKGNSDVSPPLDAMIADGKITDGKLTDGKITSPCLKPGGKGWDCYLPSPDVCEAECVDVAGTFVIRCDPAKCECEVSGVLVGSCPFTQYFNSCTTCSGAGWSCCSPKF
jgi:hypothetical protein